MLFERAGYRRTEPGMLHGAESFLELSGEDIRRRLFVTQDAQGREMCLRPEFTIPVAQQYLATREAGKPQGLCYFGPVFRHRPDASGEFLQAGLELFGRKDAPAADAEVLDLACEASNVLGGKHLRISLGDLSLVEAFLRKLNLSPGITRRVRKALSAGTDVNQVLAAADDTRPSSVTDYAGVMTALEGVAPREARAFVEDMLSIAGISTIGGRSASEIAERFLEKARNGSADVPEEKRKALAAFLALTGDPDSLSAKARALCAEAGIDIGSALDAFDSRIGFMAARGIEVETLHASTAFARNLDYYTGMVFEISGSNHEKPLVGGGRYDGLLKRLGSPIDIPAVGCAIWVERFGGANG
jgi:ATP phosphoribosyltransferase regulatory subunit